MNAARSRRCGCSSRRCCSSNPSSSPSGPSSSWIRSTARHDRARVGSGSDGSRRRASMMPAASGQRPFEHPDVSRVRHERGDAPFEDADQRVSGRRDPRAVRRCGGPRTTGAALRPGCACTAWTAASNAIGSASSIGGSAGEHDLAVVGPRSTHRQDAPSARTRAGATPRRGVDPHAQQRRCDHRRDEHDEDERGVEVVVEHAGAQADAWRRSGRPRRGGSCRSRSATCRRRCPCAPTAATSLPITAITVRTRGEAEHRRLGERTDVGVDADLQEEHRDEDVADGRQLAARSGRRARSRRSRGRP